MLKNRFIILLIAILFKLDICYTSSNTNIEYKLENLPKCHPEDSYCCSYLLEPYMRNWLKGGSKEYGFEPINILHLKELQFEVNNNKYFLNDVHIQAFENVEMFKFNLNLASNSMTYSFKYTIDVVARNLTNCKGDILNNNGDSVVFKLQNINVSAEEAVKLLSRNNQTFIDKTITSTIIHEIPDSDIIFETILNPNIPDRTYFNNALATEVVAIAHGIYMDRWIKLLRVYPFTNLIEPICV